MPIQLDQSQQAAVTSIARLDSRIYFLTGPGGCGKTFTLKHLLIQLWADDSNEIEIETTYLAAPTGKAAKVIADSLPQDFLDNEPATIHRLLAYHPRDGWGFNEDCPLDASMVIIDEASMIDSELLARVINALPAGCWLILVGDVNQLPPVGPGQPFTDFITHGNQEIVHRLTTNHRQTQGSLIANGCLNILAGEKPLFGQWGAHTMGGTLEDDLFFVEQEEKEDIPALVMELCRPWHKAGLDYAVLAPQRTGVCGVEAINKYLQAQLNPPAPGKAEIKVAWLTLRTGDKVMQTKNNYGLDVFNGYTGLIRDIDVMGGITVDYDGQEVLYTESEDVKHLALGYCMTIHKSQGSQFQYGVMICHSSHYYMWSRGLFYTGVSRFKKELNVVGNEKAIKRGISNVINGERNTFIKLSLEKKGD